MKNFDLAVAIRTGRDGLACLGPVSVLYIFWTVDDAAAAAENDSQPQRQRMTAFFFLGRPTRVLAVFLLIASATPHCAGRL